MGTPRAIASKEAQSTIRAMAWLKRRRDLRLAGLLWEGKSGFRMYLVQEWEGVEWWMSDGAHP